METTPFGLTFVGATILIGTIAFYLFFDGADKILIALSASIGILLIISGALWVKSVSIEHRKLLRQRSRYFRFLYWPFKDLSFDIKQEKVKKPEELKNAAEQDAAANP